MSASLKGRENIYTCQTCGKTVTTVDRDDGVTPFSILHSSVGAKCRGVMYSSFYPEGPRPAHVAAPTYEWYKPESLEGLSPDERWHCERGGLLLRKIMPEAVRENLKKTGYPVR